MPCPRGYVGFWVKGCIGIMEKEHGNYYLGFWVKGLGIEFTTLIRVGGNLECQGKWGFDRGYHTASRGSSVP